MPDTHIAIIFDFDDTLVPDSTSQLLEEYGMDPDSFWEDEFSPLLTEGYDPANAYITLILEKIGPDRPFGELTIDELQEFGSELDGQEFPGLPEFFEDIEDMVSDYRDTMVDFYCISGGFRNIIIGTELSEYFRGIYASELAHGPEDHITRIKKSVNFTEKTRYLFEINKGFEQEQTRQDPYLVNKQMDQEERRVPFENMIYVGDGLTDIPCFSLLSNMGGSRFGVFDPADQSSKQKALQLIDSSKGRVQSINPPEYNEDDALGSLIRTKVEEICVENQFDEEQAL